MKYLFLILLTGCAATGPYKFNKERISPYSHRLSNDEIVCYLLDGEIYRCKWRDGSETITLPEMYLRQMDPVDPLRKL